MHFLNMHFKTNKVVDFGVTQKSNENIRFCHLDVLWNLSVRNAKQELTQFDTHFRKSSETFYTTYGITKQFWKKVGYNIVASWTLATVKNI